MRGIVLDALLVRHDRLRTGWRILVFFLMSFPVLYGLTFLFWEQDLVRYPLLFVLLLGFSLAFARRVDKRPAGTVGYKLHSRSFIEYGQGLLLGLLMVSLIFFLELALGGIEVRPRALTIISITDIFVLSLITTLFQSAFEELYFRGYVFQNLIEGTGVLAATLILSLLFGAGHLLTPHASLFAGFNLVLFGVAHSLGYWKTRSLWFPSGLHFGWNFFLRNIFSLPVSGRASDNSLLLIKDAGPAWLTGGQYGPEAGVPALILLLAACFVIAGWKAIHVSPEMSKAWSEYHSGLEHASQKDPRTPGKKNVHFHPDGNGPN